MEGLYHLKHLEYIVIKKKPKDQEEFKRQIMNLCKYSPLKQITFYFHAKYQKSPKVQNNNNNNNDYWSNLETFDVGNIKNEMNHSDHPQIIDIRHNYMIPTDIPQLSQKCEFSDYCGDNKNI